MSHGLYGAVPPEAVPGGPSGALETRLSQIARVRACGDRGNGGAWTGRSATCSAATMFTSVEVPAKMGLLWGHRHNLAHPSSFQSGGTKRTPRLTVMYITSCELEQGALYEAWSGSQDTEIHGLGLGRGGYAELL